MPTLYDYGFAPNTRRVRIFLAEKGIAVDRVEVDLGTRAQLEPAFLAINPRATVPVLALEDGTMLTDCAGIFAWADALQPDPPLLGVSPAQRGVVAGWAVRVEQDGLMAVAEAFRNGQPTFADRALAGTRNWPQLPQLVERGQERTASFFAMLDAHLADRAYIAGDALSLADINALVTLDFAKAIRVQPTPEQGNLIRWRAAMNARASAKA